MANKKDLKPIKNLETTPISQWGESEKLKLVQEAYNYWLNSVRNVHETYVRFSRLYMNQYKSNSNLLGSKMLFTKHNEVLAMLRSETKKIEMYPRKDNSKEKVDNLKDVRNFDEDEMGWNSTSRVWDNDASLYGFGVINVTEFDTERGTMMPKNVNPFLAIYDPMASNRKNTRYAGEVCHMTYDSLIRNFTKDKVDKAINAKTISKRTGIDENTQMVDRVREYTTGLQNTQQDIQNALGYYQIIDIHIKHAGELYRIVTDINCNSILKEETCEYEDGAKNKVTGKKESLMPYIYKSLYQMPNSIQGLGVGHVVEDDHKADVQITNYMFEGVKQDATPRMLYKQGGLVNPRDLRYATANRNVATVGSPADVTMPFPKTNVVNDSTMGFLNLISSRSDSALGSSRILRASISDAKKSATEIAVAKAKQDELVADRVKDLVEADKEVWKTYVARMRKYYPETEKKNVRIIGKTGEAKIKSLSKADFMPETDPDIIVESKLVAEPTRIIERNELVNSLPFLAQTGGNVKNALRRIYRLSGMTELQINTIIPQTPDEMRASMENEQINAGTAPIIDEFDNDMEHLDIHQMADDNDANRVHRLGHMLNYLRKQKQAQQAQMTTPNAVDVPSLPERQVEDRSSGGMAKVDNIINSITQ